MTNDNDDDLFRRMMHDVTPLRHKKTLAPKPPRTTPPIKRRSELTHAQNPPRSPTLSDPFDLEIAAETVLCYGQDRLPSKRFRELRQGHIPIEARLDLHGLRIDAARNRLWEFITCQPTQGIRCVLIIHGKGGQNSNVSVLKSHVNHWLKQCLEVLAFHSARPNEGGTGAVYVLLKKEHHSS